MDVEASVLRAQAGDVAAYEDVINHYLPRLRKRASTVHYNYPTVDPHNVESELTMTLHRCIEQFNPTNGRFEHFVNTMLVKAAHSVLQKAKDNAYTVNVRYSFEHYDQAQQIGVDWEDEVLGRVLIDRCLRKVKMRNEKLYRFAVLVAAGGYTQEEIARACGYDGSSGAAKLWYRRRAEQLAGYINRGLLV